MHLRNIPDGALHYTWAFGTSSLTESRYWIPADITIVTKSSCRRQGRACNALRRQTHLYSGRNRISDSRCSAWMGLMRIARIQTAKRIQKIFHTRCICEGYTNILFWILVTSFSKRPTLFHRNMCTALGRDPRECIVEPNQTRLIESDNGC